REAKTETLEKYMGRELRSRYLNPEWIEAMLQEGYAGARFINKVVDNPWGWTVTTPDKIDDAKWQELYETYVADRYHLDIKEKFRAAQNLLAYQALIDRMLTAINKGYWQAAPETVAALEKANMEVVAEAGVACYADTCSSPEVTALAQAQDRRLAQASDAAPAPADAAPAAPETAAAQPPLPPPPAAPGPTEAAPPAPGTAADRPPTPPAPANPAGAPPQHSASTTEPPIQVQGAEMEEITHNRNSPAPDSHTAWVGVSLLGLIVAGW